MVDCGTTYYSIIIEDKRNGLKLYHTGGNILFNTPTKQFAESKVYYSLSGAKRALKSVNEHISDNLKAYIQPFNHNIID